MLDTIKRRVGSRLPHFVVRRIVVHTPVERQSRSMTSERLAFRLYIIQSMDERFNTDVETL
jgi:hypothetical protein